MTNHAASSVCLYKKNLVSYIGFDSIETIADCYAMFQFWLAHNHTMVVDIFKPFVPISPRFLPSKLFTLGSSHELTYLIDAPGC